MTVRVLGWNELTVTPWANGAGTTREIARWPLEGPFAWRLSAAEVPTEAPFSALPGIERSLGVLAGGALDLSVAGVSRRIGIGDPPVTFDGAAPTIGAPADDAVTDLNLMVRGGEAIGALAAIPAGAVSVPAGFCAITALVDEVSVRLDGTDHRLGALDSLLRTADAPGDAVVTSPYASGAVAYLATIDRPLRPLR